MITQMHDNVFFCSMESVGELDTRHLPRTGQNISVFRENEQADDNFVGRKAPVKKALEEGWPEGVDKVIHLAEVMRGQLEKPKSFKRRQKWMEDGDEPSWEREQAGRTEIWRTSRRETMRGPTTVELMGAWGGLAHLTAEQLMWDGITLIVLCDLLEEAGYRIGASMNNVSTYDSWGSAKKVSLIQVVVKQPQSPLDIASLVPLSFPGVYRWHGWNAKTLAPFPVPGFGGTREFTALPSGLPFVSPRAIQLQHVYSEVAAKAEVQRVLDLFKDTSAVSTYIP